MKRITYCPACNGLGYINTNEDYRSWSKTCQKCSGKGVVEVPVTNHERVIQNMTPEIFADIVEHLCEHYDCCSQCPVKPLAPWICNNTGMTFDDTLRQEATQ